MPASFPLPLSTTLPITHSFDHSTCDCAVIVVMIVTIIISWVFVVCLGSHSSEASTPLE